jgi:uncharacterized OB-fold protein
MKEARMQLLQSISSQTEFTIQSFFKSLNEEGKLTGVRCKDCGSRMVPPRPVCSRCLSRNLESFDLPDEGRLVGFSEVHVTSDAFQSSVPYVVAIADLGNGIKIPGIIRDVRAKQLSVHDRIRIETRTKSSTEAKSSSNEVEITPAYWFRTL